MFVFKSIFTRLLMMLVLPVLLFLGVTSMLEYVYIRTIILEGWQESTGLRLERASRLLDQRLDAIIRRMQGFAQTGKGELGEQQQDWLLAILQNQDGVRAASIIWERSSQTADSTIRFDNPAAADGRFIQSVSPPRYFLSEKQDQVILRSGLVDKRKQLVGHLEVFVGIPYLLRDIKNTDWQISHLLCLVDNEGRYVVHPDADRKGRYCFGEYDSDIENALLQAIRENYSGTLLKKSYFNDRVVGYYHLDQAPWALVLHASGSQILEPFLRFRLFFFISTILSVLGILLLMRWGLRPTVAAIQRLSHSAEAVAEGRYDVTLPVTTQDEIGRLTQSFNKMIQGLQERDLISAIFGRYVDPRIAKDLLRSPLAASLGGDKREVVILMTDIRGFTPLAESLSPEITIQLLNQHFSMIIETVQLYGGIIVDFFGDSILVFFDPLDSPLAPAICRALKCALQIQATMPIFRAAHPEWPPLELGLGLHAGEVVVGNIGSESRSKYGIVGSAVNLTHRIQAQAHGGEVVVSQAIYELTRDALMVKRKIRPHLKGIEEPVNLYVVQEYGALSNGYCSPGEGEREDEQ